MSNIQPKLIKQLELFLGRQRLDLRQISQSHMQMNIRNQANGKDRACLGAHSVERMMRERGTIREFSVSPHPMNCLRMDSAENLDIADQVPGAESPEGEDVGYQNLLRSDPRYLPPEEAFRMPKAWKALPGACDSCDLSTSEGALGQMIWGLPGFYFEVSSHLSSLSHRRQRRFRAVQSILAVVEQVRRVDDCFRPIRLGFYT